MSGGVGPSGDIGLPKEELQDRPEPSNTETTFPKETTHLNPQSRRSPFTFRQLNALAVIVVLAASGMVSLEDTVFVLFSLIYMFFLSKIAFPLVSPKIDPPVFLQNNKFLGLYLFVGAVIGLFLPIAYIFEGIVEGDKEGIKAAAPHVFLLASQVFMEGVGFSERFSSPIRIFVPVFYNSRRIFTIAEWLSSEISKEGEEHSGSPRRLYVGRALAVANMAFWCFNLFGFLLPVHLPKSLKQYYAAVHKQEGSSQRLKSN